MVERVDDPKLKDAMSGLCDRLVRQQEPLGEEFAQVLDEDRWDLYETDDPTMQHPLIDKVVEEVNTWLQQKRHDEDLYLDVFVRGEISTWVGALHAKLPQAKREGTELCYGDPDSDEPRLSVFVFPLDGKSHVKIPSGSDSHKIVFVQT